MTTADARPAAVNVGCGPVIILLFVIALAWVAVSSLVPPPRDPCEPPVNTEACTRQIIKNFND